MLSKSTFIHLFLWAFLLICCPVFAEDQKQPAAHTDAFGGVNSLGEHTELDTSALTESEDDVFDDDFYLDKRKFDRFGFTGGIGKRRFDKYGFSGGIGKRRFDKFGFSGGIGKRRLDKFGFSGGIGKRRFDKFGFSGGIGKRRLDKFGYAGGIGKRRFDRFGFSGGIGKRRFDKFGFSGGIGKRGEGEQFLYEDVDAGEQEQSGLMELEKNVEK